ncbi:hypothetical protein CTEN210_01037 [Chaetoceros tenuissimus]|uniref:CCHC-type domain-containing protein n=1 Tax=Chaetoceros tenuissimus TaxID=426638 RepID=A0AAD3CFA0_9STRA|nr:hypothetical protein CTEN210_01037 [Chaetoceros tenuissimus]
MKNNCFHCGLEGHQTSDCPKRDEPQTAEGKEVQKAFFRSRKEWNRKHGKVKHRKESPIEHYSNLKSYLLHIPSFHHQEGKFQDPNRLFSQIPCPHIEHVRLQKAISISKAHREFFNIFIQKLKSILVSKFQSIDHDVDYNRLIKSYRNKNDYNPWTQDLNNAVKKGEPADFSNEQKNRMYTLQKLDTRTRYLYLLMMDDNIIADRLRQMLLDKLQQGLDGPMSVNVCSIGGGPGYEHVAVWIVLLFLINMNKTIEVPNVKMNTTVFDLFGEWKDMAQSIENGLAESIHEIQNEAIATSIFQSGGMSMKLCDIRESLDSTKINKDLLTSLECVDIICFSFVIHENSSFILTKDKSEVQGAILDILKKARIGTFIVFIDSNNFCWEPLKTSAKEYGWEFFGASERKCRIIHGPKEYVLMQRMSKQ